jgi:hypothetical protein
MKVKKEEDELDTLSSSTDAITAAIIFAKGTESMLISSKSCRENCHFDV